MHCPGNEDVLPMDTILYMGFGGYMVMKGKKLFYAGDPQGEWESFKTLADIEKDAAKEPNARWSVHLDNPLRGAIWRRQKCGEWLLKESNLGFA